MRTKILIVIGFIFFNLQGFSQQKNKEELERAARKDIREGNKLYNNLKFAEAEIAYKKALSKNPNYPKASYNLGNSIYQQNRNKEAVSQFELVEKTFEDKLSKAEAYHNMGNSFMKEKEYGKAVEAFKNSLRNNSNDDETRYNLALAKELLKNQQQNKDDNKDKNSKEDNKNDKKQDKKENEGGDDDKNENKDKDKGKDKENDKGKPKNDKKDNNNKQQPRPNKLTPEQMKQLLEAMNNEENKTQKKLNLQKAKGKKIKQEKDW